MSTYNIKLSGNRKTGEMFVSTSSSDTCPDHCQHLKLNTCYAKFSFLGMHWRWLDKGNGSTWEDLCNIVKAIPDGELWRHNQAGDLPGSVNGIDLRSILMLVEANRGKRGFTFTHKHKKKSDRTIIQYANAFGFTINISADSYVEAALYFNEGYPTTVTCAPDNIEPEVVRGVRFITCPAVTHGRSCVQCGLCYLKDRDFVIKFPSHGSRKNFWMTVKKEG